MNLPIAGHSTTFHPSTGLPWPALSLCFDTQVYVLGDNEVEEHPVEVLDINTMSLGNIFSAQLVEACSKIKESKDKGIICIINGVWPARNH